VTTNASPFPAGGNTKDVNWTVDTKRGELIFGTGDFASTYASNSSNSSLYRYKVADDKWTLLSGYCHPAGQISPDHITDRGALAYDKGRDALWLVAMTSFPVSEGQVCNVSGPPGQPTGSIWKRGLLKMSLATGVWEQALPASAFPGEVMGNGYVDGDTLIYMEGDAHINCVGAGTLGKLVILNLTTLTPQSFPLCISPTPVWANGAGWMAPAQTQRTFFSFDPAGRVIYVVASNARLGAGGAVQESRTSMFTFDLKTGGPWVMRAGAPANAGNPYHIATVWDAAQKRVLWPVIKDPCGVVESFHAYDPAKDAWVTLPLPAEKVHGSTVAYDSSTGTTVFAGSVFCPDYQQGGIWLFKG